MPKDKPTNPRLLSPYSRPAIPPLAVSTRRRSLAPPKNYTFAPNVTPITYPTDPSLSRPAAHNDDDDWGDSTPTELKPGDDVASLAEASASGSGSGNAPAKKRRGGRKDSIDHIPRPPNAFMLYRQEFVRQRHVPGSIETSHHSLSRIVGQLIIRSSNALHTRPRTARDRYVYF